MGDPKVIPMRRWKQISSLFAVLILLYLLHLVLAPTVLPVSVHYGDLLWAQRPSWPAKSSHSQEWLKSLVLNESQCAGNFPGLFEDINTTIALGPFTLKPSGDGGPLQLRLQDGQLYVLGPRPREPLSPELLDAQTSALHQIHRAIITSPTPLPNTIFAVNIHDQPFGTAWSYSRPAYAAPTANMPPLSRAFLMPHFSFWAWPLPFVGSFSRAAAAIDAIEASTPFARKKAQAVWRGTTDFYGPHNPSLRKDLLAAAKGASWADVEPLRWEAEVSIDGTTAKEGGKHNATNALPIENFCRYKYVLHTEGITYSGRLQFLQMCGSVLITPPLAWLQHTTHLMKPVFSRDLGLGSKNDGEESALVEEGVKKAWPVHYRPEQANVVFVAPDWSDLGDTVRWLEEHPEVAGGIAERQRDLFVDQGYLSPAAEACYWRALIRGWSTVVRLDKEDGWGERKGIPWELFAME